MLRCPYGFILVGQTKLNLKLRIAEHKMAIKKIKTWIKLLQGKAQGRTTLICCLCCIHKDYETLLVVAAL